MHGIAKSVCQEPEISIALHVDYPSKQKYNEVTL